MGKGLISYIAAMLMLFLSLYILYKIIYNKIILKRIIIKKSALVGKEWQTIGEARSGFNSSIIFNDEYERPIGKNELKAASIRMIDKDGNVVAVEENVIHDGDPYYIHVPPEVYKLEVKYNVGEGIIKTTLIR